MFSSVAKLVFATFASLLFFTSAASAQGISIKLNVVPNDPGLGETLQRIAQKQSLTSPGPLVYMPYLESDVGVEPKPWGKGPAKSRPGLCELCMNPAVKEKPPECAFAYCMVEPETQAAPPDNQTIQIIRYLDSKICRACGSNEIKDLCNPIRCMPPLSGGEQKKPWDPVEEIAYKRWLEVVRVETDQRRWAGTMSKKTQNEFLDAYKQEWRSFTKR